MPRRCPQSWKSITEAWGEGRSRVTSHRTFIAHVRHWENGPSLSPADVANDEPFAVAAGCTTGVHEVATLFSHTQDPRQKWEALGLGKAVLLHQRTQQVLKAARLLPAHKGSHTKPSSVVCGGSCTHYNLCDWLPACRCSVVSRRRRRQPGPLHTVNGFSAGSYTHDCSSLPSTMTWAPCPHGVRTRGKKN